MASQCKRQQCTIDRRGFRQELDSWRHKLIHCVGFESILEGLFGPELVEDLKLFKDLEPIAVSDWSFDENCLFCCLRRDKVKEHLIGLSDEGLENTPKPLLVKDQATINRLERQAEEFLNAVLCRKDVPNFSDPHVPVVAREILQRMIRQFAAEYTSKTSSPQDTCSDSQPRSDQSLPTPPLHSGATPSTSPAPTAAGPAHNQNPVLSKLLMADQDAPLDLTIKKPLAVPTDQDGVLDLSIKKNRYPCLSPAPSTLRGESPDLRVAKAKDLQSTSTLEQLMAKLCPHHQRQIVNALGFLQTEVKALTSSNTQQDSKSTSGIQATTCSTAKSSSVSPDKSCPESRFPSGSTPKSEVQDLSQSMPSSCAMKKVPENAVSLKTSVPSGPALDLRSTASESNQPLVNPATIPVDNNHHGDHAPLKMKIMASNVADGKKLSCVLTSLSSHTDDLEDREGILNSSSRTETHSARLSSSAKRHSQASHIHPARQRDTLGHAKDTPAKLSPIHTIIPPDSPRTARKTIRGSSDHRIRDTAFRVPVDPDFGHCDIVFIDRPITECFKEHQRSMVPRRNARKSTRGHMYSDEIWELKTVRTLAGRGNCPNPMPELITLVTPKQILSKPEGVPPVDMPFAGACRESINQQMSTEESDGIVIPGTGDVVEVAASEVDIIVETSQTDQCQGKGQSVPPSPTRPPTENNELDTVVEQDIPADTGMTAESEESVAQVPFEFEQSNEPEPQVVCEASESTDQVGVDRVVEPSTNLTTEETETQVSTDDVINSDPVVQKESATLTVNQVEEEIEKSKREEVQDEQPQELQPETLIQHDNSEVTEESDNTGPAEELEEKELESQAPEDVEGVESFESDDDIDCNYDVSSKTLDALLKELPPWRRKRGTVISLPRRLRQAEAVVVGYVNGRPVSASDRSLRRRSSVSSTSPHRTPVKSSPNKTPVKSPIASNIDMNNFDTHPPETHSPVETIKTTPVVQQVEELSSDTPSSPASKSSSRTKQTQKRKRVQSDQGSLPVLPDQPVDHPPSSESKRQLRSAGQRPAESSVSPPTSKAVASISSLKTTDSQTPPSSEHVLPLPDTVTSPLVTASSTTASEQSQESTESVLNEELNTEKSEVLQNTEDESKLQAKKKPRSAKTLPDKSSNDKLDSEVSSSLESPEQTEMQTQIMPLRSKRVLRKEAEASNVVLPQKQNVASLGDRPASGDDSSSSISEKPTRMPLRSESSKTDLSVTQSSGDNKKLALRSQRLAVPSTSGPAVAGRQNDITSPVRIKPEKSTKTQLSQAKSPPVSAAVVMPHSSAIPAITPRLEPPRQTNKFFETLTAEENQHLITNLNVKYDKMQKGWVQMDKDGQPTTKYKNKADRQAAIWKSKRRAKKIKCLDHQKYSPVQMLFMKGFNLTSICRWFLETTETKSLVIVKKVNTRLPSETQLCFHSSSSASGTSQGVFPSLQAERLKKHLKKFAIASPVKSNPKSQKLIAKALEQEANAVKGKERKELPSTPVLMKSQSYDAVAHIADSQKTSGKSKNPASARILRKYSNIREKMQVQQTNARNKNVKRLSTSAKSVTKSNLKRPLKAHKSSLPVSKQIKVSAAKMEKRKALTGRKPTKLPVQVKAVKAQSSSRTSKDTGKREMLPKRSSQRLGSPKVSEPKSLETSKSKTDKKQSEADKVEVDKPAASKGNATKIQAKESSQTTVAENKGSENVVETPQQSTDVKVPTSPDQVLTRSQRKIEAAVPPSGSSSTVSKRVTKKPEKTQKTPSKLVRKAEEPTQKTRRAIKSTTYKSKAASSPRVATKSATKRAKELLVSPAKRTRMSLSK